MGEDPAQWPANGLSPLEAAKRGKLAGLFSDLEAVQLKLSKVRLQISETNRRADLIEHYGRRNFAPPEDREEERLLREDFNSLAKRIQASFVDDLVSERLFAVGVFAATGARQRINPEDFRSGSLSLRVDRDTAKRRKGKASVEEYWSVRIFDQEAMMARYIQHLDKWETSSNAMDAVLKYFAKYPEQRDEIVNSKLVKGAYTRMARKIVVKVLDADGNAYEVDTIAGELPEYRKSELKRGTVQAPVYVVPKRQSA